jgi:hypothetical protein
MQTMNLFKSILHNIGVVIVGLAVALLGTVVDSRLGWSDFRSILAAAVGSSLLTIGFLTRL